MTIKIHSLCSSGRLVLASLLLGGVLQATPIPVVNASFENAFTGDPNTGWAVASGGWATYDFTGYITPAATDGALAGYSGGGVLYQILTNHTMAAGSYTVRIDLGQRSDLAYNGGSVSLFSVNGPNGTVGLGSFTMPTNLPVGGWVTFSFNVCIPAGSPAIGGNLQMNVNASSGSGQTLIDNVRVDYNGVPAGTPVTVNNPSFESAFTGDANTGWQNPEGGGWGTLDFSPYGLLTPPATDGAMAVFGNSGQAFQILTNHAIVAGTYTILLDVGRRSDGLYQPFTLGVFAVNRPGGGFESLGGFSLPSDPASGGWSTLVATIVIPSGGTAIGGNLQLNLATPGSQAVVDNVRVYVLPSAVPSSAVLTNVTVVSGSDLQFTVSGSGNQVVQVNNDLANPGGWMSLYTNTAPFVFTDINAVTLHAGRFYRALAQ